MLPEARYATAEFKGAGGRIADAVAASAEKYNTMSFSLNLGLDKILRFRVQG